MAGMENSVESKCYLDDLRVGQRFTSGSHKIDDGQIKLNGPHWVVQVER